MINKLKVAAYCRVSTNKDDQVNSLGSQRQYFTDYIIKHDNWQLVDIYYDEGVSGTSTKKRTGFNSMIADANAKKIDLILTKEISRFARNTLDSLKYTRELKSIGVGVIFINDSINTLDADAELRLTIMSSIAQEESRKISERVKWGQKRRMEQGVAFGNASMLGYTITNGKLTLNPKEAETIRLIYHKYLNEGKGTHVIARELEQAGIRPKRAKDWSSVMILRVLRNEKYAGDLLQKKSYTPDYLSHSRKLNKGNEETVYIKDNHEAIIDRETWNRTQEELTRRSPIDIIKSKYSNRYWCSGKVRCGECGRRYVSKTQRYKGEISYNGWRCHAAALHGRAKKDIAGNEIGCDTNTINDKALLACVKYVVSHVQINQEEIIKDLTHDIQTVISAAEKVDTAKLQAKIGDIIDKKKKAIDFSIGGIISREDLKLMNEQYDGEIFDIQREIREAEKINKIQGEQLARINYYVSEIKDIANSDSGVLYRDLLDKIVMYKNNCLAIYLKCLPFGFKLRYKSTGRGAGFSTVINNMEIL